MTNAELLAALKPPPEFCFLWIDHWSTCMTKSEWSGWAQAIGAILAIGVAFGIAVWQEHVRSLEGRRLAVFQSRNAAGILDVLVTDISTKHAGTVLGLQSWHVAAEQVVMDFRAVQPATLCLEWNVAILALRNTAIQVELALRAAMGGGASTSLVSNERLETMHRSIDRLRVGLDRNMKVISGDHPGIKMPPLVQLASDDPV